MSKSTSISDLPVNNSVDAENTDEAMMVNSILQEIEQEDEYLNDENVDSLNYVMDTSQVPPKINNEIPTPEVIKSITEEIFQQKPVETIEKNNKEEIRNEVIKKEEIKKVLEDKPVKDSFLKNIDGVVITIKKKVVGPIVVLILFMIMAHPGINKLILKILPKLSNFKGEMNNLGNFLKGLFISSILFVISFFV